MISMKNEEKEVNEMNRALTGTVLLETGVKSGLKQTIVKNLVQMKML